MKRQLSHANIFNYKLIGAMAGAMGMVLYPLVAGAESTNSSESDQDNQKKSSKTTTENQASKASRKHNRSRKLIEALEKLDKNPNQNKNLIALNKVGSTDTNLPASLQDLVEERNHAAEYILAALKTSEDSQNNLPASLRKLVDKRNNAAENTLISLKSAEIFEVTDTQFSLVQKIKYSRNQDIEEEVTNHQSFAVVQPQNVNTEKSFEVASVNKVLLPINDDLENKNSNGEYL
ncbi:MAG: hypothetical protein AAFY76_15160, partial [Cyanobacteria bacterium J06649_11]